MADEVPKHKYANGFLFGALGSVILGLSVRRVLGERMSTRFHLYFVNAIGWGVFMSYFDFWRRVQIERALYKEYNNFYHFRNREFNKVRVGDEEDEVGLMDYLTRQN